MAVDKHKIWLISSIVIVILIIGFIFLYPNVKKGLAGQAFKVGTCNDPDSKFSNDPAQLLIKATTIKEAKQNEDHCKLKDGNLLLYEGICTNAGGISFWPYNCSKLNKLPDDKYECVESVGACVNQNEVPTCLPQCVGKTCGDDGCGGSCGSCAAGSTCTNGACVAGCTPSCGGKTCGDDGCGGSCGSCVAGTKCQDNVCKNQANYICSETDGGKDFTKKGTVYSYNSPTGKSDSCDITTGNIIEYYCFNNNLNTHTTSCPSGFKCDGGACVPSGGSSIISLSSCATPTEGWQSGKTYKLSTDITTTDNKCFSITGVKDIIFDCDGHKIIGGGIDPKGNTLAAGIHLNKVNSSTIKNCLITSFPKGIYLSNANKNVLFNNVLGGNKQGIYLLTSPETTFNKNIACTNELKSLFCLYSSKLSGSGNLFNADKVTCTTNNLSALAATAYSSCSAEICTDKLDNDGDFDADCKDNDCVNDDNCKLIPGQCNDPDKTYTPFLGKAMINKNTFDINSLNQQNNVTGLIKGNVSSGTDKCLDGKVLEYYCNNQTNIGWAAFDCPAGKTCTLGACVGAENPPCTPFCTGKTCGDDGCGGSCGSCASGTTCSGGSCLTSCTSNSDCPITCDGTKGTRKNCEYDACGGLAETWLADECAEKVECTANTDCAAGEKCESNKCVSAIVGISGDYTNDQKLDVEDIFVLQLAIESAQPQNSGCGASVQDSCSLGGIFICENGKYSESSTFVCSNEIPLDLTGDGKLDVEDIFILQLAIEAAQPQNVNCGASSQDSCSLGGIYICENAKYSETSSFKC